MYTQPFVIRKDVDRKSHGKTKEEQNNSKLTLMLIREGFL
jgi:hypothetical protein